MVTRDISYSEASQSPNEAAIVNCPRWGAGLDDSAAEGPHRCNCAYFGKSSRRDNKRSQAVLGHSLRSRVKLAAATSPVPHS
jgi:hypothetical protein